MSIIISNRTGKHRVKLRQDQNSIVSLSHSLISTTYEASPPIGGSSGSEAHSLRDHQEATADKPAQERFNASASTAVMKAWRPPLGNSLINSLRQPLEDIKRAFEYNRYNTSGECPTLVATKPLIMPWKQSLRWIWKRSSKYWTPLKQFSENKAWKKNSALNGILTRDVLHPSS